MTEAAKPKFLSWSRHDAKLHTTDDNRVHPHRGGIASGRRLVQLPTDPDALVQIVLQLAATEDTNTRDLLRAARGAPAWPHDRHPQPSKAVKVQPAVQVGAGASRTEGYR